MVFVSRRLSRSKKLNAGQIILQQEHVDPVRFYAKEVAVPVCYFAKEAAPPILKGDEMVKIIFFEVNKKFETDIGILQKEIPFRLEPKPPMRVDRKGMALLMAEFDKMNKKLGIQKEDLPKYEEQLELKIARAQLEELKKDALGAMEAQKKWEKFKDEEMVDVDTMIIQAIGLLDDLDKELNTYAMRVREWYGWHFPELAKIVQDNILYAKAVKLMGNRTNAAKLDFSEILPEEVETELKEAAVISMGTEVNDLDLMNIKDLCDQVLALSEYRAQLYDYLKSRMNTIAPNLTVLVGELVGARLIAHGGSLLNLAKQPGSTVQILGAEKALFRALKTKHATPKYGLIFHASLIGQAAPKLKGKISRSLAAKTALAIRYDALGDGQDNSMGLENRAKLEARLRNLEGRELGRSAGSTKGKPKIEFYDKDRKKGAVALITAAKTYNPSADSVLGRTTEPVPEKSVDKQVEYNVPKKRKQEAEEKAPVTGEEKKEKKKKKKKAADVEDTELQNHVDLGVETEGEETVTKEKKKKKARAESADLQDGDQNIEPEGEEKKKKKKRKHAEAEEENEMLSKKKEKKKKKRKSDE
ncbi:hypothetical protein HHK36_026565 [Tetracentron sinense]|uniref:Nop domain-containing protein n=1 Tax=Tetracentron sinense TaxID=13715 RepID=A0A835D2B1_TETSI|nr:hypothetical protein HHK36_026565 [Tetracentron sinense]